ncbi:unnamed protein product [Staurois parvus]|uniref:Uncharacterized protein n=1 Tax=Staurois parvus TaxID=386267 RepID=A0ABN9CA77_9NEOB|nr:unnamed protein product [Staurois parvus]
MYVHTQTHVSIYTQTHTETCTCTHRHMYTHIHVHTRRHVYRYTHYFVVHSQSRVLHSRERQRAQYTLLPLLSLRSAIEQSDSSQCQ